MDSTSDGRSVAMLPISRRRAAFPKRVPCARYSQYRYRSTLGYRVFPVRKISGNTQGAITADDDESAKSQFSGVFRDNGMLEGFAAFVVQFLRDAGCRKQSYWALLNDARS
jgi:hypothetical protein